MTDSICSGLVGRVGFRSAPILVQGWSTPRQISKLYGEWRSPTLTSLSTGCTASASAPPPASQ